MLRTTKKSLGFFSHDQKSPCWQRVFGVLCAADPLVQNSEPESSCNDRGLRSFLYSPCCCASGWWRKGLDFIKLRGAADGCNDPANAT